MRITFACLTVSFTVVALVSAGCQSPDPGDATDETSAAALTGNQALLVVGSTNLGPGDKAMRDRMTHVGLAVTVKTGSAARTTDATGMRLVVVSSTVASTDVKAKFRDVAVPVLTYEANILGSMGMTRGTSGTDFGVTAAAEDRLSIHSGSDPMKAGLSGVTSVMSTGTKLSWGKPGSGALVVATLIDDTTKAAIFRYEKKAQMFGLTAPERRVALFLTDGTAAVLNNAGQALTDAALRWSAHLPALKANGVICGTAAECGSNACQDGVCCNSACTGCMACNLPGTVGTCAPVPAGQDPKDACAAQDPSTCGLDGACDGSGACRRFPDDTECGAPVCDGDALLGGVCLEGSCLPVKTISCGGFICHEETNSCAVTCSSSGDCAAGFSCDANTGRCLKDGAVGSFCQSDTQCQSGTCGNPPVPGTAPGTGRCCAPGTSCVCHQPSAGNLLTDPGVDNTQLAAWNAEHDFDGSATFSTDDRESCPFSGSILLSTDIASASVHQCITIPSSGQRVTYQFGASVRASVKGGGDSSWQGECRLESFDDDNCAGDVLDSFSADLPSVANLAVGSWVPFFTALSASGGSHSLRFTCSMVDDGGATPDNPYQVGLDQLFVNASGTF